MVAAIWIHLSGSSYGCTGRRKLSYVICNFTTGDQHAFGGVYLELIQDKFIKYTDTFDNPNLVGEMQVTVSLRPVSCGTELNIIQEGIPDVIPVEMCYLGWQESLEQLSKLVEPDIPH